MILWKNGHIHTLNDNDDLYHDMVTSSGVIISFDHAKDLAYDQIIDLKGAHVYPGFVDAHMHILGYGEMLSQISLAHVTKKQDLISYIKKNLTEKTYIFYGLNHIDLTKNDLDQISMTLPIIIKHADYHTYTVNTCVLETIGIESNDGLLNEEQILLLNTHYLKYSISDLENMIKKSIEKLYQYGITGSHSDDLHYHNGYVETIEAFKHVLNIYPFRAQLLIHHEELKHFKNSNDSFLDKNMYLELGAVKMFYDGTLSSKTALLKHPYNHLNHWGTQVVSDDIFINQVKEARDLSMNVAIHVIGDQGLENVIDILKKHPPKKGLYDRIIHASLLTENALLALKNLPVTIDVQPQFISSDFPQHFVLFSQKPEYIYPFNSMLKAGLIVCGSSDAPVEDPNPLLGMYNAVTRNLNNQEQLSPNECISRIEALKLYTTYANVPTYKQNRGKIGIGYIADFTIFDSDILEVDIESLKQIKPIMTVINEKIVYKK